MLRVEDHPAWERHAKELAEAVSGGKQAAGGEVAGPRVAASVQRHLPDAVHVFVPDAVDRVERVLLSLGAALGDDAAYAVDEHLRCRPDELRSLLGTLSDSLSGRPVLVDGWQRLGASLLDREVGLAMHSQTDALRGWLGRCRGVFLGTAPSSAKRLAAPDEPPVQLRNGSVSDTAELWTRVEQRADRYALALSCRALGATADELEEDDYQPDALRARVLELLPPRVRDALELASVHGRPLPQSLVPEHRALVDGERAGVWNRVGSDVVVEAAWRNFVLRTMPHALQVDRHRKLAAALLAGVKLGDPSAALGGLSILEAHRHFVAAGDVENARECWRYGAAAIIEAARDASVSKDGLKAARLYGIVLEAATGERIALPQRVLGYVRHYYHFNRGHTGLESLVETEAGYRAALEEWPDNALFWSRLVRVLCFQGRSAAAMKALEEAQRSVPEHHQKQTFLVARTVRGLVARRDYLLDAIRIWADYRPDTPFAEQIADELESALADGFATKCIPGDAALDLIFRRDVKLVVRRHGAAWAAALEELDAVGEGATPWAALCALRNEIQEQVRKLVRRLTTELSAHERLQKRLLLGAVNVPASRLDAEPPDSYWYVGRLERDADGAVWFHTEGSEELRFRVPDDEVKVLDDLLHLARVAVDPAGLPSGRVLELEPGHRGSDDELWDEWQQRFLPDVG